MRCFEIIIEGIVQGVGFRPFVYNYANGQGYKGFIKNTSFGVVITIACEDIESFISYIKNNCPPLSKIYSVYYKEITSINLSNFSIIQSSDERGFTNLSPDVSVCNDCLIELTNTTDRRYLYPFINCINCGPRYSIIERIPYDRPNTTMSSFLMCPDCLNEYNDPKNRRFHAQPNACSACGPSLNLLMGSSYFQGSNEDLIKKVISLLKQGAIVAIKGIGGFHLACDANNSEAIKRLREKKRRSNKPFALMSANIDMIRQFCHVSDIEGSILSDMRRPIVLLKKLKGLNLHEDISPKNGYLGFMLPYTPIHYMLFGYPNFKISSTNFSALIMTSGNISEEPIVKDNDKALEILSKFADALLIHNRDIFMRVDDSVLKVHNGKPTFIRRARGYVPQSIQLSNKGIDIMGSGADIKNTFAFIKDRHAIISHHIGDLENLETLDFFQESFQNLKTVFRVSPGAIAHDIHPNYHSVRWALDYAKSNNINPYPIQHHYAHIASVMAENSLKDKLIGVAFDGNGYGTDGNLWGGEFLICDIYGFERYAHFNYIPLPGGEMAVKEAWRCAVSYLRNALKDLREDHVIEILDNIGITKRLNKNKILNVLRIADISKFSPLTSAAGRLFDAISALIGLCYINTFEGEAAIALESLISENIFDEKLSYRYQIIDKNPNAIDFSLMIIQILEDIKNNEDSGMISLKFHNTLVNVIINISEKIRKSFGINDVALSGGVFQNKFLAENAYRLLKINGFNVFLNEQVPCNDGGISLGQAYILHCRLNK